MLLLIHDALRGGVDPRRGYRFRRRRSAAPAITPCPKASEEGTRGALLGVCRVWGFDRAATSAKAGLVGVVKGGLPSIIEHWPPPLHSTV